MTNEFLIPYRKKSRWGYYSFGEKKVTIPCKFINASTFTYISELDDELAIVEDENLFGKFQFFINQKGEKRIKLQHKYIWVSEFFNYTGRYFSKAARKKFTGIKIGIINEFGNDIFKCEYDDCGTLTDGDGYYEKLLPVKKNNKWGIINDSNKLVVPFHFDFIGDFNEDGVAVCTIGAFNHLNFIKRYNLRYFSIPCYGFIDKKGRIINQAYLYNNVRQFSDGLAAVQKPITKKWEEKGKWGFINSHFDEVLSFYYQDAKSFSNGLAAVREYKNYGDSKWGFIDKSGKLIIGYKFDNAYSFSKVSFDPDIDLAAIEINKKWGFIDKEGNLIIECKFEEVYS
ncbi:MAG TPA: WG repeat-containing protein, partial [Chitinophagaceae bacterium]